MGRRFEVGDPVQWDMGLVKKLDGSQEHWIGKGKITSIEGDFMFILYYNGNASAKKIRGRWLVMKSDRNYQLRIRHAL